MRRRGVLTAGGASLVAGLAGCTGGMDDSSEDDTANDDTASSSGPDGDRSDADTLLTIREISDLYELPFDATVVGEFNGDGSTVTDSFALESGPTILAYEFGSDTAPFSVDLNRTDGDTLYSHPGIISRMGDSAPEFSTGSPMAMADARDYVLDIDADTDWSIHVAQPRAPAAEIRTMPVSTSGAGRAVVGPIDVADRIRVTGEFNPAGDLDFLTAVAFPEGNTDDPAYATPILSQSGDTGSEIDGEPIIFEGLTWGTAWVSIGALGDWSLEFEA
ncbi:hypothetical protein [Natronorubrum texcoconense]|uniref:Uncharacterized protein n=1 Tax=Natronorubrum texcoconense TaxID=1095776 RepID=A0A1G9G0Q0_9EURY|nr:hypothetical protein [Natronorubrum texcoconense]SDK94219.1 hypothetical protein SAMN04515672_4371 [Natronorubrum texcoconense]